MQVFFLFDSDSESLIEVMGFFTENREGRSETSQEREFACFIGKTLSHENEKAFPIKQKRFAGVCFANSFYGAIMMWLPFFLNT